MNTAVAWYDSHAAILAAQYEGVDPGRLHAAIADLLPKDRGAALDVGAGTGRDAAWLAGLGFDVVAVEPSRGMREEAARLHRHPRIQWVADGLPELGVVSRLGLSFDVILLSAVWMHVLPADRPRAFRKLIALLKPGGMLTISLRFGHAPPDRGMHPVSASEIEQLAKDHGAFVERSLEKADEQGRPDVHWMQMVVRLPDDATGALPLLRHVILNDDKSSTYKLALVRSLCRIADGVSGCARLEGDRVAVPLGLVALFWIRLFKPLLAAGLPQTPANLGLDGLGFVKAGFRKLTAPATSVSHHDLRVGMRFTGERADALHEALRDACKTIEQMPARYMTYPGGGPILTVRRTGRIQKPATVMLDAPYLTSFGEMLVPAYLWKALQRFEVWIEPALVAEWSRLIKRYADKQGHSVTAQGVASALSWREPARDVRDARRQAIKLIKGPGLQCVWSGKRLTDESQVAIDHCLPWAVWPCSDLWNLMPAHPGVNNRKRDRLPGETVLRGAQDRILQWWQQAYLGPDNALLPARFRIEAMASLPFTSASADAVEDVFSGLALQRLRLKHDQQVPEWPG